MAISFCDLCRRGSHIESMIFVPAWIDWLWHIMTSILSHESLYVCVYEFPHHFDPWHSGMPWLWLWQWSWARYIMVLTMIHGACMLRYGRPSGLEASRVGPVHRRKRLRNVFWSCGWGVKARLLVENWELVNRKLLFLLFSLEWVSLVWGSVHRRRLLHVVFCGFAWDLTCRWVQG